MIRSIKRMGNSKGIILDPTLLEMAKLKEGDEVSVVLHEGGTITLTPVRPTIEPDEAASIANEVIANNSELFRRLSL